MLITFYLHIFMKNVQKNVFSLFFSSKFSKLYSNKKKKVYPYQHTLG
jgi:hypothetical protein